MLKMHNLLIVKNYNNNNYLNFIVIYKNLFLNNLQIIEIIKIKWLKIE